MPLPKRREWHGFIGMVDPKKELIERLLCFLGRRHNRSPNSIWRNVKIPKDNVFILIISIYVLDIEEYESSWWRTQTYDSCILDVEREKLDLLAPGKTSGIG